MKPDFYIVTGNTGKFDLIARFLKKYAPNLHVEQKALDIDEIQSLDMQQVARAKALAAWEQLKHPLIIDDGGIYLEQYNNFPGTLSKYVVQGIGIEGFLLLTKKDRTALFRTCIAFIQSPEEINYFYGECRGQIVNPSHFMPDESLPYRPIFQPDGYDTTIDLLNDDEQEKINHRLKALRLFLEWYAGHKKKQSPTKDPFGPS